MYPVIKPGIMDTLPVELIELICEGLDYRTVLGVVLATGVEIDVKDFCFGGLKDECVIKLFKSACINSHVELLRWLYEKHPSMHFKNNNYRNYIYTRTKHSNLRTFKFMHRYFGKLPHESRIILFKGIVLRDIEIADWLYDVCSINISFSDIDKLIHECIMTDNYQAADWLHNKYKPSLSTEILCGSNYYYKNCQDVIMLKGLQWVHSKFGLTWDNIKEYNILQMYCDRINLKAVKWICENFEIYPDMLIQCFNSNRHYKPIAKYLYDKIGEVLGLV